MVGRPLTDFDFESHSLVCKLVARHQQRVAQAGSGTSATSYRYEPARYPGAAKDRAIVCWVDDKAHEILIGNGQRVRFWCGADRQRYKQEEAGKRTYCLGIVEVIIEGGARPPSNVTP